MDRDDCPGSVGQSCSHGTDIDVVVVVADIDDDRAAAALEHRFDGGCERERGHHDFVARLELARQQREPQAVEATADADAMSRAAVRSERRLELLDFGPVRECARVDHLLDPFQNRLPHGVVRRAEVEKRDFHLGTHELTVHDVSVVAACAGICPWVASALISRELVPSARTSPQTWLRRRLYPRSNGGGSRCSCCEARRSHSGCTARASATTETSTCWSRRARSRRRNRSWRAS